MAVSDMQKEYKLFTSYKSRGTDLVKLLRCRSNVAFNYIQIYRVTNVLYIKYFNLLLYEVIDAVSESSVVQCTVVFC